MTPNRRRVVGVLGGMGPMATAETLRRIVLATPAASDQEHLHVIVDSNPAIPDRTDALAFDGEDPRPHLETSGRLLVAAGAEIICMPCNTAHAYFGWLQQRLPVPVVDMVEETGANAAASGARTFGLLATAGTAGTGLYQEVFERLGLTLLTPSDSAQVPVSSTIAAIKAGDLSEVVHEPVWLVVDELATQGAETLVVGCTELSLVASRLSAFHPLIDALDVLVAATVAAALGEAPARRWWDPGGPNVA